MDYQKFTKEALSFFRCPMCRTVLQPPIHLCKNGHGLCGDCYRKLINPNVCPCPVCRKSQPQFAFSSLHRVLQGVKCKYSAFGCKEVLFGVKLRVHMKKCPFKFGRSLLNCEL